MTRSFFFAAAAFLVAAILFAGGPSLRNGFLNYDDPAVVVDNPRLEDPSPGDVVGAFTELRADAWLPLYIVALMPDALAGGKDPRAFHIGSLVWHAIASLLVLGCAFAIARRRVVAVAAAAVFAVHPILAESTAWAAGRKDQVSFVLLLLSLAAGVRHLRAGGRAGLVATPLLFAMAMLAKGSVVVQPVLLAILYAFVRAEGGPAPSARPKLLFGASGAVAIVLGAVHYLVARSVGAAAQDPGAGSVPERAMQFVAALGRYVFNTVAPVRLSIHYDVRPSGVGLAHLFGIAVIAAGAFAAVRLLRARPSGRPPFVALAVAWWCASLLPFNGVFPSSSLAMADRYLIVGMPAVGFLLGLLLDRLPPRVAAIALVLALAPLAFFARGRYAEFKDGETVFRAAMEVDSRDPLPPLKAGEAVRAGPPPRPEAAARLFAASFGVARDPVRRARALVLRADALAESGWFLDAAIEHERLAVLFAEHGPLLAAFGLDADAVRFNAAVAELGAGRLVDAREKLNALLADRPLHPEGRLLRAGLDRRAGFETLAKAVNPELIDRAREAVNRSISEMRAVVDVYEARRKDRSLDRAVRAAAETAAIKARADLSRTYAAASWRTNFLNDALAEAESLVRDFPDRADAYLARAEVLRGSDPRHADEDVASAAAVEPRNPQALRALADVLLRAGRNQDAVRLLLAAKEHAPEDAAVARALAEVFVAAGRAQLEGRGGKPDPTAARAAARSAREHVKDDPAAWTLEGDAAEAEKDLDGAMACYEQALALGREYAPASLALARAHQSRGLAVLMNLQRYGAGAADSRAARAEAQSRAAADFRAAVRLAPEADETAFARGRLQAEDRSTTADPVLQRARAALAQGRAAEAVELAAAAIRLDEAYATSWEVLGHAAIAVEDYDRAFKAWRRTAALDPERLPAILGLARLHWRRGEYEDAKTRAEGFLRLAAKLEKSEFLASQEAVAKDLIKLYEEQRRQR